MQKLLKLDCILLDKTTKPMKISPKRHSQQHYIQKNIHPPKSTFMFYYCWVCFFEYVPFFAFYLLNASFFASFFASVCFRPPRSKPKVPAAHGETRPTGRLPGGGKRRGPLKELLLWSFFVWDQCEKPFKI